MNVELSPGTVKKAEQLVLAGEYPDIDSAIAAALEVFQCSACRESTIEEPLDAEAREALALGRFRTLDDDYLAELRAEAEAIIASKSRR